MEIEGIQIHIEGIVQGVGFRPFVFGLAQRYGLTGWVRNTSAGVDIQADGPPDILHAFSTALQTEAPLLARIFDFQSTPCPPGNFAAFVITPSEAIPNAFQPISPDVSICPDCLRELFDPTDHRYRYPFINCTNCGPRFTIIRDIPYDRPKTTMAGFPLCPECEQEYHDPLDRRFHAQPVACPVCGPQVWLELPGAPFEPAADQAGESCASPVRGDAAILVAQRMLNNGKIIAIKGIGGFHLACDAANPAAVEELRRRKLRVGKPFAVMLADIRATEQHCQIKPSDAGLLESIARPIVILERKSTSDITALVTPGQSTVGVMLPYTPLHALLFANHPDAPGFSPAQALVMTSGNLSEEPIAITNDEARQRLALLADAYLMHNRPVHSRCDDSVMRSVELQTGPTSTSRLALPLRRSRGYSPFPVRLPGVSSQVLAVGGELKNTFCLSRERLAFLSHHIGDLENYETLQSFEDSITHYEKLFRITPAAIACDLHPDYLATRYAQQRSENQGIPLFQVQHHHAHIAACMAENGLSGSEPVIGIAFDGTGYGLDAAIWGGEFLVCDYTQFTRAGHLAYTPLPGGDSAIRRPARVALAHLWQAGLGWDDEVPAVRHFCADDRTLLRSQLEHRINAPLTSSMGRLFDAAAALAGVRNTVTYEAQAAIEFEALVDPDENARYQFEILDPPSEPAEQDSGFIISPVRLFHEILADIHAATPLTRIAACFHNAVARMVLEAAITVRKRTGLNQVALSGGVWQNTTLLKKTVKLLQQDRFIVHIHTQVPSNDGGLSLGQAVVAAHRYR